MIFHKKRRENDDSKADRLSEQLTAEVIKQSTIRAEQMYRNSQDAITKQAMSSSKDVFAVMRAMMSEIMAHDLEVNLLSDGFRVLVEEVYDMKGKDSEYMMQQLVKATQLQTKRMMYLWNTARFRDDMVSRVREELGK